MIKEIKLTKERVKEINSKLDGITVCTIGDICLDYYVYADMRQSLLSKETPHYPLPVIREVYSLGGGGNVVNNIKALNVGKLIPVSLLGNDWRGYIIEKHLKDNGFDDSHILRSDRIVTNCYMKPMRMGFSKVVYEDPRIDYENRKPLNREDEERIIKEIDKVCGEADVIAVSDQMKYGIITDKVRERINYWASLKPVIADSRDHVTAYKGVIVKPNEVEAAQAVGMDISSLNLSIEDYAEIGRKLSRKNGCPAIVTLGEKGSLWCDENGEILAPTVMAEDPIDICGAGDTFLSACACAYAAGASGPEALAYGNLASGVTVKKIGMTGTATREEILKKYEEYYG